MSTSPALCLASTSPRRREILIALGLEFSVQSTEVEEQRLEDEPPEDMVLRLARAKIDAVDTEPGTIVLGADAAVVLGETVLGKPLDCDDAIGMLLRLSGRTHRVVTGVALRDGDCVRTALSDTNVGFREIGRDEALRYWQSGEPCDKAGAYAIQGLGGVFVQSIAGSYSGVVGLPVFETAKLLRDAGIGILMKQSPNDG